MVIDYKDMKQRILDDIEAIRSQLNSLYQTIDEVEEYGFAIVFGSSSSEESIKSAFEAGRAIGELEGKIDQLQSFLNFLYSKEQE